MYDANLQQQMIELRQTFENLQRRVEFLFDHLGVREPDEDVPLYVRDATRLVRENRMNEAVRLVVEHTAVGLAEARIMVEELAMRVRTGARTSAQAPGPSAGATVIAAVAASPRHAPPPALPVPASVPAAWTTEQSTRRREYDVVGPAASR